MSSTLQPGQTVTPSLTLVRPLGVGGMGSVWIARHSGLASDVVVKFMADELVADPAVRDRFTREASSAAQVRSPHVVQMLDHGITLDGLPFIAMELLDGTDLGHRMQDGPALTLREGLLVIQQCCKALARAHERGVVHRDIKPENIFLLDVPGAEIFVKLLDFGIAKRQDGHAKVVTQTGFVIGTPQYMSPEQVRGAKELDHRTDLFSLGVVAYEMLTGQRPFEGNTLGAIHVAICTEDWPAPTQLRADLPSSIDGWMHRALARSLDRRFATAMQMSRGLDEVLTHVADMTLPHRHSQSMAPTLEAVKRTPPAAKLPTLGIGAMATPPPIPTKKLPWAALGGALFLVAGISVWLVSRTPEVPATRPSSTAVKAAGSAESAAATTATTPIPTTATTATTATIPTSTAPSVVASASTSVPVAPGATTGRLLGTPPKPPVKPPASATAKPKPPKPDEDEPLK